MNSMDLLIRDLERTKNRLDAGEERRLCEIMNLAREAVELLGLAKENGFISEEEYQIGHDRWLARWSEYRTLLFEASSWWAIKIAHRFRTKCNIAWEDLVQEALFGALKGVDRFDPDRGRLTSAIFVWVKERLLHIQNEQNGVIRLPCSGFWQKDYDKRGETIKRRVDCIRRGIRSIDRKYPDDEKRCIADNIPDPRCLNIVDEVDKKLQVEQVYRYLDHLPKSYRYVVIERSHDRSLLEIAHDLNLSRERVRQIEERSYKIIARWAAEDRNKILAVERLLSIGSHFVVDERRIPYDEQKRMELIEPFLDRLTDEDRWLILQRASGKTHKQLREMGVPFSVSDREQQIFGQIREWYFQKAAS